MRGDIKATSFLFQLFPIVATEMLVFAVYQLRACRRRVEQHGRRLVRSHAIGAVQGDALLILQSYAVTLVFLFLRLLLRCIAVLLLSQEVGRTLQVDRTSL